MYIDLQKTELCKAALHYGSKGWNINTISEIPIDLNLIIVQKEATYSVYYISVGSSTCFGCWHTSSSGVHTAIIIASGID